MGYLKIITLSLLIIVTACSKKNNAVKILEDGTEIISNYKAEYDSCSIELLNPVRINLKKNGIEDYISTDFISSGGKNIILASKNELYLFSDKGDLIKKKDITGKGPGEISSMGSLFTYRDKLYISCVERKIINEYNFNTLEFIREISVDRNYRYTVYDSLLIGYYNFSSLHQGTGYRKISILNNDFEEVKSLYENEIKFDYQSVDPVSYNKFLVNATGGYIYYHKPDKNNFIINGLGINGNNRIIKKDYRKTLLPDPIIKELNEINKSIGLSYKADYYYAIENIKVDKDGNLWIREWKAVTHSQLSETSIHKYHIFDKNGIYKSYLIIDIDKKYYDCVLDDNKIIFLSLDDIIISDYKIDFL